MDLRQLRYFMAVCQAGSVAAASRALHVAQPALSRQISALEQELGAGLFVRLPRGVALTRAGEALRQHAGQALADVEALRKARRARCVWACYRGSAGCLVWAGPSRRWRGIPAMRPCTSSRG
jgi:DNA-binding transcriptional LysR family regulator